MFIFTHVHTESCILLNTCFLLILFPCRHSITVTIWGLSVMVLLTCFFFYHIVCDFFWCQLERKILKLLLQSCNVTVGIKILQRILLFITWVQTPSPYQLSLGGLAHLLYFPSLSWAHQSTLGMWSFPSRLITAHLLFLIPCLADSYYCT